jgi:hypothetical protein
MHTTENRGAIRYIAKGKDYVLATSFLLEKAVHFEGGKRGRQLGSRDKYDGHRVLLISMRAGD